MGFPPLSRGKKNCLPNFFLVHFFFLFCLTPVGEISIKIKNLWEAAFLRERVVFSPAPQLGVGASPKVKKSARRALALSVPPINRFFPKKKTQTPVLFSPPPALKHKKKLFGPPFFFFLQKKSIPGKKFLFFSPQKKKKTKALGKN